MTQSGNLWAVGYDDMGRANEVRDEIISLGWGQALPSSRRRFIPAGTVHTAKNVRSNNGAEPATYIVEKGKPRLTVVK